METPKIEARLRPCPRCGVPSATAHFTDGQCLAGLKKLVETAASRISMMEQNAAHQNRAMWVIADREGGRVRVTGEEMDAAPKGAKLMVQLDQNAQGAFWIIAAKVEGKA